MALVRCPECGKSVSSYAQICPCCGFPISRYRQGNRNNYGYENQYNQEADYEYSDYRDMFPSGPEGDDMYESWMDDLDD